MLTPDAKVAIERAWRDRAKFQDYKFGTQAYRKAEIEFFTGAMTTLNALFPNKEIDQLSSAVPIIWVINSMTGRPIVEGIHE